MSETAYQSAQACSQRNRKCQGPMQQDMTSLHITSRLQHAVHVQRSCTPQLTACCAPAGDETLLSQLLAHNELWDNNATAATCPLTPNLTPQSQPLAPDLIARHGSQA